MMNRSLCLLAAMTLALGCVTLTSRDLLAVQTEDHISELIKKLGSSKYSDREKARRDLEQIGLPALEKLKIATKDKDLEISRRSRELVKKLEDKLDAEAVFGTKLVKLSLKETTVKKALDELQKQSGNQIVFQGDPALLAKRTISIETEEVTFWKAFDKLCSVANLCEIRQENGFVSDQAARLKALERQAQQVQQMQIAQLQLQIQQQAQQPPVKGAQNPPVLPNKQIALPNAGAAKINALPAINLADMAFYPQLGNATGTVFVRDGTPESFPTFYQGALRIRLLPLKKGAYSTGEPPQANEVDFVLEVTPEPRLQQFSIAGLPNVEKTVDDKGRNLSTALEKLLPQYGAGNARLVAQMFPDESELSGPLNLRVKLGDKEAHSLAELAGKLTVRAQHPTQEALITLPDVLNAIGKSAKGKDGSSMELRSIKKQSNGTYAVQFRLQGPQNAIGQGQVFIMNGAQARVMRGGIGANYNQLTNMPVLIDAKGKSFTQQQLAQSSVSIMNGQVSQDYTIIYRSDDGVGEPAQLILMGNRLVTAEIPFHFEGVKLPKD